MTARKKRRSNRTLLLRTRLGNLVESVVSMRNWPWIAVVCMAVPTCSLYVASFSRPEFTKRKGQLFSEPAVFLEPSDSNFGRRDYWNKRYSEEESFSWYTKWADLSPFFRELVPCPKSYVLIPGMGNDASIVDMYEFGYQNLTAFDYSPSGVDCARRLFGGDRIRQEIASPGVTLLVADARDLPFPDSSFDAVLEKGTLDAIYLSGGRDKELAAKYLEMSVKELARVVVEGGIVVSVTAACVDAVQNAFHDNAQDWELVRDGSPYISEDGYASNNVDGTLLAWKRTR